MRQRLWSLTGRALLAIACLHLSMLPTRTATADGPAEPNTSESSDSELATLVQKAKGQFHPFPADRVADSKRRFEQTLGQLEPFLDGAGIENGNLWRKYLHWAEIREELDKADSPNLDTLEKISDKLFQNHQGLELPPFVAMRNSLKEWKNTVSVASTPNLESRYALCLDQLAELLPEYAAEPTVDRGARIATRVDWLEQAGQANKLVQAIDKKYRLPNLVVSVSEPLASVGFQTEVADEEGIQDCILGTSITGHATIQGKTNLRFVDNPKAASLDLLLTGTVHSNNHGYNRGVCIHSLGTTSVNATKRLTVTPELTTTKPAVACCSTSTTTCSVTSKSCLKEKIGRKQVRRKKGQAEQIASRRAESRIEQRVDAQTAELLAKTRETYQEKFRKPLLRRGQFPQRMNFATKGDTLSVQWCQANERQLAAPTTPPAGTDSSDLSVRVHESFVANFSRAMIGGMTLTDEMLVEFLKDVTGSVPEELEIGPDTDPWSITFSSVRPVSAEFSGDTVRFAIRGRRFSRGDDVVKQTLELSAVFKLHKTPSGAHLVRQGGVEVDYVGTKGRLSTQKVAMRTVMKRKFEALFKSEFNTDGIKMPGRWSSGGMLFLKKLQADNGWVSLDWDMKSEAADLASK